MKVYFEKEKETKRTIRFKEIEKDTPAIGMIYIPKQTLQDIGYKDGDAIVIELTVAE